MKKSFVFILLLQQFLLINAQRACIDSIDYEVFDGYARVIDSHFYSMTTVAIKSHVNIDGVLYQVKETSLGAFRFKNSLKKVIIPNTIETIGEETFRGCINLKEVVMGNSVKRIGYYAFGGCDSLKAISLPNSLRIIGASAFRGCKNLENINIPNSVTHIEYEAFGNCISLKTIEIPKSVKSIGDYIFAGCVNLQSVYFYNDIETITAAMFSNCRNLQSIKIPDTVTKILAIAFTGCSSLKTVFLSDNINTIGSGAFKNCSSLDSIHIGRGIESIADHTFEGCRSLRSIYIPDNVTSIGKSVFRDCINLETVYLGRGIKSIDELAFVIIDNEKYVEIIEKMAETGVWFDNYEDFYNATTCNPLKDIYCYNSYPPSLTPRINESPSFWYYDATVHVPLGSKIKYQNDTEWKNFMNIVEDLPTNIIDTRIKKDNTNQTIYRITGEQINSKDEVNPNNIYIINGKKILFIK